MQSWTPLPPFAPYHLSGSSPCTSPKHPVSCIEHRLAIRFLHDSIHVSAPFSQIIPPSPSPLESKSRFCTSVSLLLSHPHIHFTNCLDSECCCFIIVPGWLYYCCSTSCDVLCLNLRLGLKAMGLQYRQIRG